MEKKFIVPAVSFLAALILWIAFFVLYLRGGWPAGPAPWPEVGLSLVVGGLILFSGIRCRQVGGPLMGTVVRSGVLLVMSLLSFWKVGIIAACILLAAAILTGVQACRGSCETGADGE